MKALSGLDGRSSMAKALADVETTRSASVAGVKEGLGEDHEDAIPILRDWMGVAESERSLVLLLVAIAVYEPARVALELAALEVVRMFVATLAGVDALSREFAAVRGLIIVCSVVEVCLRAAARISSRGALTAYGRRIVMAGPAPERILCASRPCLTAPAGRQSSQRDDGGVPVWTSPGEPSSRRPLSGQASCGHRQ